MRLIRTTFVLVCLASIGIWSYLRGLDTGYDRGKLEGERQALSQVEGFSSQTILSQTS